jgi:hypothetical protein
MLMSKIEWLLKPHRLKRGTQNPIVSGTTATPCPLSRKRSHAKSFLTKATILTLMSIIQETFPNGQTDLQALTRDTALFRWLVLAIAS